MTVIRTLGGQALLGTLLMAAVGCGWNRPHPISAQPKHIPRTVTEWSAHVTWLPVSIGPQVLLAEGAQVSSVLAGPKGRIYYGAENPLGDAATMGWINPATGRHQWATVPPVSPPFPPGSGLGNLSVAQSATWAGVDLVVSGSHNVWYRHWGYVGAWSATTGQFVKGDYAIPGPTVHAGQWTASTNTTFAGVSQLKVMNLQSHHETTYPLPAGAMPTALAMTGTSNPTVWLLSSSTVWSLSLPSGTWQPVASVTSGDFFVAMGQWGSALWVLDANGQISRISVSQGLTPIASLSVSPLAAASAPQGGIWIVSPHHLSLWMPHQPWRQWHFPTSLYPAPANTWPQNGANEPPLWPPAAHISAGPHGTVLIGDGTWVGIARLKPIKVPLPRKETTH